MIKKIVFFIIILVLLIRINSYSSRIPVAKKQTEKICISGGTIHVGNGNILENNDIIFENGKIISIGSSLDKTNIKTINATGKHIYPGFILLNTFLGLIEIEAVVASRDEADIIEYAPNIRSIVAYNTDSDLIPNTRYNGILMAQVRPYTYTGVIPGSSSVVQLDAWNWEDAIIKNDNVVHINWPKYSINFVSNAENLKNYSKKVDELYLFFKEAMAYCQTNNSITNLKFDALCDCFTNKKRIFVDANEIKEIIDAVDFFKFFNLENKTIVSAEEAHKLIPLLKDNGVNLILNTPYNTLKHENDPYNLLYTRFKLFLDANILTAMYYDGHDISSIRNLGFSAGNLVVNGISKEQALSLITLNAAKILGLEKNIGTIEIGKDATLFISNGDALDPLTNNLTNAFIQGREIILETKQTQLYKTFKNR